MVPTASVYSIQFIPSKSVWFIVDRSTCFRYCQFSDFSTSQGSTATTVRCGGQFNDNFTTKLLLRLQVKEFWKSENICWSHGGEYGVFIFNGTECRQVHCAVYTPQPLPQTQSLIVTTHVHVYSCRLFVSGLSYICNCVIWYHFQAKRQIFHW